MCLIAAPVAPLPLHFNYVLVYLVQRIESRAAAPSRCRSAQSAPRQCLQPDLCGNSVVHVSYGTPVNLRSSSAHVTNLGFQAYTSAPSPWSLEFSAHSK